MPNNLKDYDFPQVLRSVFDVDENCLRVCIVSGSSGGPNPPFEVIIDHTNDSIRLGDGTTLFTGTTVGPKTGLDVNVINAGTTTTPAITNVIVNAANTQFSHPLGANTTRFLIRARNKGKMNIAFINGQTGTNYISLGRGSIYTENNIQNPGALTIYFQVNQTDVVEILEWS